jgi:hypothetical protein
MMHFFKRSEVHLDCFTYRADVIEYAPVVNAIEVIPDWWRELPKSIIDNFSPAPTMKTCVGMSDYYSKSIVMPLWSDLSISIAPNSNYSWLFSDTTTVAMPHPQQQFTGAPFASSYGHLKIESPWLFECKQNINWVLTEPIYNRKSFKEYVIAQGLLNFSKQNATNIQMFIDVTTPKEYLIPFNTPFLFTPMTDKKVVIHRHLLNKQNHESKQNKARPSTFINKYRVHQKINKCPYKDETK